MYIARCRRQPDRWDPSASRVWAVLLTIGSVMQVVFIVCPWLSSRSPVAALVFASNPANPSTLVEYFYLDRPGRLARYCHVITRRSPKPGRGHSVGGGAYTSADVAEADAAIDRLAAGPLRGWEPLPSAGSMGQRAATNIEPFAHGVEAVALVFAFAAVRAYELCRTNHATW
jgi:hypothetical protein